jgi:protein-arginine deiminase
MRSTWIAIGVAATLAAAGLGPAAANATEPVPAYTAGPVDLRADVNRDGRLTAADEAGEASWTSGRGAIVLPNVDDDARRCPAAGPAGAPLPDAVQAACHDGADEVVNGPADVDDLAALRLQPVSVAGDATITVDAASRAHARFFVRRDGRWTPLRGPLPATALRGGLDLRLEARDVVRDRAAWSGVVDVTVRVGAASDQVRVRVAPIVFQHDLMPVRRLLVADQPTAEGAPAFRRDLRRELTRAGLPRPWTEYASAGEIWAQDMFQPAYASMPSAGGREHRMTILLRSPAQADPSAPGYDPRFPLRAGSRAVFTQLRGPDVGVIQQFDPVRAADPAQYVHGTFSSTGNVEAIPPYPGQPVARSLYGGGPTPYAPDPAFTDLLAAQGGPPPVVLNTAFLGVGHVDEVLMFAPAKNARGWVAVVADPRAGRRLLQDLDAAGLGGQRLIQGVPPEVIAREPDPDPELTVAGALAKETLTRGTEQAAAGIEAILAVLRVAVGLTADEVIRVPALFNAIRVPGYPRPEVTYSLLPNTVNGLSTGTGGYLAPRVHGPRRAGRDAFEAATTAAFAGTMLRVGWVEDYAYAHTGIGELHCVTNAERDLSGTRPWWGLEATH